MKATIKYAMPLAATIILVGCGGSSSSNKGDVTPTTSTSLFSKTATWTFEQDRAAEKTECFDFDSNQIVDCSGTNWDIKMVHGSSGSATPKLYTNSGTSGEGNGAALGSPFDYSWEELKQFTNGNVDNTGATIPPMAFMADATDNAFTDNVFIYGAGYHMSPTYNVFVVTTDTESKLDAITENHKAYAIQMTDYYGGSDGATSGNVTVRWVDVNDATSSAVQEKEIDATSDTEWAHYGFSADGNLTKVDAPSGSNWQVAFRRYNIKTNSGISGTGSVGTFKATAPTAQTDAAGLAALTNKANNWGWGTRSSWGEDGVYSSLNPTYKGTYPNAMDFGFYKYYPTDAAGSEVGLTQHMLGASAENGVMLRSGEGNSYARMRIAEIKYAEVDEDEKPYNGQRTYTIEFDVTAAQ